jgi:uncharacterized membrane protein YdbT with pleckstrin-like domain
MESKQTVSGAISEKLTSGAYERLGWKTLWIFILNRISAAVILLVVAVGLFALGGSGVLAETPAGDLSSYASIGALIILGTFIGALIIIILISWLTYANYLFALGEDALKIRRGILDREEVAIPYRQIQNVDIEEDITDRMWGVCRLIILTAGHEDEPKPEGESEGILPVIDKALAEQLQAELLHRTDVQRVVEAKV